MDTNSHGLKKNTYSKFLNSNLNKNVHLHKKIKLTNNDNVDNDDNDDNDDDDNDDNDDNDDTECDETECDDRNKSNDVQTTLKTFEATYFDPSDSSDSENELEINQPNKFALNLLKKIHRHNQKTKPNDILKKFNIKINNLNEKYLLYSKNPLKYRNLRQFYKNLTECKNLSNFLMNEIEFYKTKFNFTKFFSKYKSKNGNGLKKDHFIFDILFETLIKQPLIKQPLINTTNAKLNNEFKELYEKDNIQHSTGMKYFESLDEKMKLEYINKLKKINNQVDTHDKRSNYMKILDIEMDDTCKNMILQKIKQFDEEKDSYERTKKKNWINKIMSVPFGTYIKPPVDKNDSVDKIKNYFKNVRKLLDDEIYGHYETKSQLIKILAHTISNPIEGGNVFALQGPPGIGKTALIQDGISKALGRPFAFISLGGATDASFLEGHDYCYVGSQPGKIVELLQKAKCMNPVIYFDELDKVSETAKGEEIINILMHLTDSTQNSHFNDKYFNGIDLDLSKAIIIFSFNEEHKISPTLRDRMKIIRVKGYKMSDKINIARDYLIPKLLKQIGIDDIKINISDKLLEFMIDTYTNEGGVRKLKEILNDVLLEINLRRLEENEQWINKSNSKKRIRNSNYSDEIILTEEMIEKDFLKKKRKINHLKINSNPMVGIVNGLWANNLGIGGIIPIECCWVPSREEMKLNLTGMQGNVMKESMSIARTVAWRILPDHIKEKLNKKWDNSFDNGIHIHCPDGATPKDGPSAGGAITTSLISLLTGLKVSNEIAMTGEINLKGNITEIGGLEEKIFGAKKAGVKLVLCPSENQKDLDEIINKFPTLFDENFQVKTINNIWDILNCVIDEPIDWIRFD